MQTRRQLFPCRFRHFAGVVALLLLCSTPALAHPQEGRVEFGAESRAKEFARERERYRASHPWINEKEIETAQWRFEHPGASEEDYKFWKKNGRVPTYSKGPSAPLIDRGFRIPSRGELRSEVRGIGSELLKPVDAGGWGYVGYTRGDLVFPGGEEVRFSPVKDNPSRVEKFFLVDNSDNPYLFFNKGSDFSHQNTIEIPRGEHVAGQDLTRFFQVNNRVLRDVPKSALPQDSSSPRFPQIENSSAIVIAGAHLPSGKEVLSIFSLSDLARTGSVHGEMYTDSYQVQTTVSRFSLRQMSKDPEGSAHTSKSPTKIGLKEILRERLGGISSRRVYYYGDHLKKVDLAAICNELGHELIFRSPQVRRNLVDTEQRLQQIAERPFDEEQLTFVDGLPQNSAAVQAMGPLAGDPGDWLNFHARVDESFRDRTIHRLTTHAELVQELSKGESDLLVVIAHSTGSQFYLNDQKISIKELQALPPRSEQSPRPRLAILISCDAGKPVTEAPGSSISRLFSKQLSSLAQILIEKKFVDKVLAPDHKIQTEESLIVLRRALQGNRTQAIFKDWIPWAVDWLRALKAQG